ncbi:hypothetical protein ACFE04_010508 [Oxalis oulophora]
MAGLSFQVLVATTVRAVLERKEPILPPKARKDPRQGDDRLKRACILREDNSLLKGGEGLMIRFQSKGKGGAKRLSNSGEELKSDKFRREGSAPSYGRLPIKKECIYGRRTFI